VNLTTILSIPKSTPVGTPVVVSVSSTLPKLVSVDLTFPKNCVGLVGVAIFDRGAQVAPLFGWATGNDRTIHLEVNRWLEGSPFRIDLKGYNLDDTWAHAVTAEIEVVA
jgi:hypothetical protein